MTVSQRTRFILVYWSVYIVVTMIWLYMFKKEEYQNSERVSGVVVQQLIGARRGKYSNETGKYPQFEFVYKDSIYISADQLYWVRNKKPGDKVKLIFQKGKPEEAVVYSLLSYWAPFWKISISFLVAFFLFMFP